MGPPPPPESHLCQARETETAFEGTTYLQGVLVLDEVLVQPGPERLCLVPLGLGNLRGLGRANRLAPLPLGSAVQLLEAVPLLCDSHASG